jgi:hypothetical protein
MQGKIGIELPRCLHTRLFTTILGGLASTKCQIDGALALF